MRRKELEFTIGYFIYLKVPHPNGMKIFMKKGKLNSYNVGPYEILRNFGNIAH